MGLGWIFPTINKFFGIRNVAINSKNIESDRFWRWLYINERPAVQCRITRNTVRSTKNTAYFKCSKVNNFFLRNIVCIFNKFLRYNKTYYKPIIFRHTNLEKTLVLPLNIEEPLAAAELLAPTEFNDRHRGFPRF